MYPGEEEAADAVPSAAVRNQAIVIITLSSRYSDSIFDLARQGFDKTILRSHFFF